MSDSPDYSEPEEEQEDYVEYEADAEPVEENEATDNSDAEDKQTDDASVASESDDEGGDKKYRAGRDVKAVRKDESEGESELQLHTESDVEPEEEELEEELEEEDEPEEETKKEVKTAKNDPRLVIEEHYVDQEERIFSDIITPFELVRIKSTRMAQIEREGISLNKIPKMSLEDRAMQELHEGVCPLIIKRARGNGWYEKWDPNTMLMPTDYNK